MKTKNRKKLNFAVGILKELNVEPENIMLVGSLALDLQGLLPETRETHDVDLIIRTSDETWKCLKVLEKILNKTFYTDYPDGGNLFIKINDIALNIWRANGNESIYGLKDDFTGVWVKPAGEILKKKKSYNRYKDLKDISDICKMILE